LSAVARSQKRLPENVAGDFFVDSTCIDCGTCRHIAPEVFAEGREFSFVYEQPAADPLIRKATQAMLACPTGSIGTAGENRSKQVIADFPDPIEDGVFYCGFTAASSYGGSSYFIRHPEGNWLVDSPRFIPHLVRRFDEMGGIRRIFLTHRDDVADAAKYAEQFKAERIIHRADLSAAPGAEKIIEGREPVRLGTEFLLIPVPGHSAGHMALLYRDKFLFTGDHLWWDLDDNRLGASKGVCWYSWDDQKTSMERLLDYRFEWVLPGHGARQKLPACTMRREVEELARRM